MYDKILRDILTKSLRDWTGGMEILDNDGLRIKNYPFSHNYGSNDLESSLKMIRDMYKQGKICQSYFQNPEGKCSSCYFGWFETLDLKHVCSFDRILFNLTKEDQRGCVKIRNILVEKYFEKVKNLTNYDSLSILKQILLEDLNELRQK